VAEALLHHSSDRPVTTPSSWIADLDPVVERAILRCLERDPVRRPASAIQVAASLPGGDPLQAALAAGETPSPEMVAAAGSRETLQPALGAVLLAATVVLLLLAVWGKGQVGILSAIPIPLPPEVLAHNAREMLTSFGYLEPPRDTAHGLEYARPYLVYARRSMQPAEREWLLRAGRPPAVLFWYRESPVPMVVVSTARPGGPPRIGPITVDNPPPVTPGMLTVRVDTQGHLVRFEGQPPEFDDRPATVAPFDWTIAMRAAGLDASSFKPVDPTWAPPMAIDQRAAWEGAHPERPDLPIRLEAAAYRGNLVAFRTLGPWDAAASAPVGARFATSGVIVGLLVMGVSIGGLWIAWLNVRAGRGDRRGAFRLGLTVLTANTIDWALTTDHVAGPGQLALTYLGLSGALYEAVGAYLLYLALEPYVRRRWPHVLISWSRALAGELRDPLVGRHVLIGLLFGALWTVGTVLAFGVRGEMLASNLGGIGTLRDSLDVVAAAVAGALFISVVFCFLIFILRAALRAAWAAGAAVALATAVIGAGGLPIVNMVGAIAGAVFGTLLVVAMIRFGLMAAAAMMFCYAVLAFRPLTLNFSTWYAGPSIVALAALGALAAVACAVAIGWQPTSRPRT
jgi:serine/threonine-protein kinase